MIEARRYTPGDAEAWDAFVAESRNGVFLFRRGYMDYHADRFADHSLTFHEQGRLVAVLPAHEDEDGLVSHGGLTFGGLVTGYWTKTTQMLEVVEALMAYGRAHGWQRLRYKAIPHIYHLVPAEEDLYALFRHGARLVRRDVGFTVDQRGREAFRELEEAAAKDSNSRARNRARNLRRARESGVVVEPGAGEEDLRRFVAVLEDVLMKVHGATPVHSYDELALLTARFPESIRLHVARRDGEMLAGAIVFESNRGIAHAQYSANSEEGRRIRALDVLFEDLVDRVYRDRRWFDFGTSIEPDGVTLNASLAEYKESQGARAVNYDTYELEF